MSKDKVNKDRAPVSTCKELIGVIYNIVLIFMWCLFALLFFTENNRHGI